VTPSTWNFESTGPRWSEIADFQPIFARSASVVTPSENSAIRLTLIGSPLRTFQWAYDHYRTMILCHQRGAVAQKRKTADFRLKLYFAWRKSATKFLCVKIVSGQSCKIFIGLIIRANMIGGGRPHLPEMLDRVGAKSAILDLSSLVATQP